MTWRLHRGAEADLMEAVRFCRHQVERNEWPAAEIEAALVEADAGDFSPPTRLWQR